MHSNRVVAKKSMVPDYIGVKIQELFFGRHSMSFPSR